MHNDDTNPIRQAWQAIKAQGGVRARDAARTLGVSEAELVACECGGAATRLEGDFRELFARVPSLGPVMALTRNESCVHERVGRYEDISVDGHTGLVLGPDIDLRVFFRSWRFGYALRDETSQGTRRSVQFFDATGTAVHKIYLRAESDAAAYESLIDSYRAKRQTPEESVEPVHPTGAPRADAEIDVAGFRKAWAAMTDTHEFFGLLKRFGVARTQALRLADAAFVEPLPVETPRRLLEAAAQSQLPIMVFVGNPGIVQIHTGEVRNIRVLGPWLNVMDPAFNLHLREDHVDAVWLVRKPTSDGVVTSIELFDAEGGNIALFFGKRKPGMPESEAWRALLATLPRATDRKSA